MSAGRTPYQEAARELLRQTVFDAARFEGIRCDHSMNPDDWTIVFPRLDDYRDSWLLASAGTEEIERFVPPFGSGSRSAAS